MKLQLLEDLKQKYANCQNCNLSKTRNKIVFGKGNADAKILILGHSPGSEEDKLGIPFVGRSGELLDEILKESELTDKVYIVNPVLCHPEGNRIPLPEEINACNPILQSHLNILQPEVITLLGAVPLDILLRQKGITKLRVKWQDFEKYKIMPTFHPSYCLRDPNQKQFMLSDFKQVKSWLDSKV